MPPTHWMTRRQVLRATGGALAGIPFAGVPLVGCVGDGDGAQGPRGGGDAGAADAGSRDVVSADAGRGDGDAGSDARADGTGDSTADAGLDDATDGGLDPDRFWYFAVIADSHVIDETYEGPESNELDTESILRANERLATARQKLAATGIPFEAYFHAGDVVHTFSSFDLDFYAENRTSVDIARDELERFDAPMHYCLGNHDYALRSAPHSFTHELFREKLGIEPYSSVDINGLKFVMLDNFLGRTMDPMDHPELYDSNSGSLGEEQLLWLEAELQQGMPTFVFIHFPLQFITDDEGLGDLHMHRLLQEYRDTIAYVISGHWHRWFDFGDAYGPPHITMGSTRYDEDAAVIVRVDRETNAFEFVNEHTWHWFSHVTEPFGA